MLNCQILIAPFLKPFVPSYTAGILADIMRTCNVDVNVIDCNNLFFNYIYADKLSVLSGDRIYHSSNEGISTLLGILKGTKENSTVLTKQNFQILLASLQLRNLFLNRHIDLLRFGFFTIGLKKKSQLIKDLLNNHRSNASIIDILGRILPPLDSDIYIISIMSPEQFYFSCMLSTYIRQMQPSCKIIVGGPFFTGLVLQEKQYILQYFDCICIGDAELTSGEIIDNYQKKGVLTSDYGTISYVDGKLVETSRQYANVKEVSLYQFNINDFEKFSYFYPFLKYPVLSSRECCYGKCLFCTNTGRIKYYCRIMKVGTVYQIVKTAVERDGFKFFEFLDDNIHANYLSKFSDRVLEDCLVINWTASTRFYEEYTALSFCQKLFDSGCRKLFMGLESYNQELLYSMNKGTSLANILPILENLKNVGIYTHISVLFGFPGETIEQAENTRRFIYKNINFIDLVDINYFINQNVLPERETLYDAKKIVKELRCQMAKENKLPSFFHVYNILR